MPYFSAAAVASSAYGAGDTKPYRTPSIHGEIGEFAANLAQNLRRTKPETRNGCDGPPGVFRGHTGLAERRSICVTVGNELCTLVHLGFAAQYSAVSNVDASIVADRAHSPVNQPTRATCDVPSLRADACAERPPSCACAAPAALKFVFQSLSASSYPTSMSISPSKSMSGGSSRCDAPK